MRRSITTFMAIAGLAALSQAVFGQQMRQMPYATAPEPMGRYYNAVPMYQGPVVYQGQTAPHMAPAPQMRMASAPYNAAPNMQMASGYGYPGMGQVDQAPVAPQPTHNGHAGCCNSGCNSGCNTGCNSGCLSGACSDCAHAGCNHCCESKCCYGSCLHQTGAFAEYLYLSPRNIDLAYAVPQDGIGGVGTVPVAEVGVLDHRYSSGMRAGFNLAVDCCSSLGASFAWFETQTEDSIAIDAPNVIQPLVQFPGTFNAGFTAQQATAIYSLDYQLVDIDYKAVLCKSSRYHLNWVTGLRYAHIDQDFSSIFPFAPPDGTTAVGTNIAFDGFGVRFGLEGERRVFARSGLSMYSKLAASAIAGENRARYIQVNQFNGVEAFTAIKDDRVMTISELELGVAWTNCQGNLKISAGYYLSVWDNIYTTPEYIDAVQNSNYTDVSQDGKDSIAFDGFVGRVEYRF